MDSTSDRPKVNFAAPQIEAIPFAKVLLLGDAGSGKSHAALTFPSPAVIDAEGSIDWFADRFKFVSAPTKSYDEARDLIRQLCKNPGDIKTIVLDSLTTIYNGLVNVASEERMNEGSEDLRPLDHGRIKRKFSSLTDELYHRIPFHVVCVGWIKAQYAAPGSIVDGKKVKSNELVSIGEQFDGDKKANHAFDFIFKIEGNDGKSARALVVKSRSGALKKGQVIENFSWATLQPIFARNAAAAVQRRRGMTDEEQVERDKNIYVQDDRKGRLKKLFAEAHPGKRINEWIIQHVAKDFMERKPCNLTTEEYNSAFHLLESAIKDSQNPPGEVRKELLISEIQKETIEKLWANIPVFERVEMAVKVSKGNSNSIDRFTSVQAIALYQLLWAHPNVVREASAEEKAQRNVFISEIERKKKVLGWTDGMLAVNVRAFTQGRTDILPDMETAEMKELHGRLHETQKPEPVIERPSMQLTIGDFVSISEPKRALRAVN